MNAKFNRHRRDFNENTLEFDVKHYGNGANFTESQWDYEIETGEFINQYAKECFDEIAKSGYKWLKDWSFAGRSGGWFVLLVDCEESDIRPKILGRIETIVEKYLRGYDKAIAEYYTED